MGGRGGGRGVPESGYRDWQVYGGGPDSVRYSALDQINSENVKRLEVAWIHDTGDAFEHSEMPCNPIVINDVLYATTPKLRVSSPWRRQLESSFGALTYLGNSRAASGAIEVSSGGVTERISASTSPRNTISTPWIPAVES